MVDLVDTVDGVHRIYLNQNRETSTSSACEKANSVLRELDSLRRSVPEDLRGFEKVDPRAASRLLALDTPEGHASLLKFRLCLVYHNLRVLASLPLLSALVWQSITKQRESGNRRTSLDLAEQCVLSAETSVRLCFSLFHDHPQRLNDESSRSPLSTSIWLAYHICHLYVDHGLVSPCQPDNWNVYRWATSQRCCFTRSRSFTWIACVLNAMPFRYETPTHCEWPWKYCSTLIILPETFARCVCRLL